MGRRDRDERPPVELWSAPTEPPPEVQRVGLAAPRRGGRTGVAVIGVIAALLGVGLLTSGGDDDPDAATLLEEERDNSPRNELKPEPSTTSRPRRTTTTSTTSTLPPGPVLGRGTGVALVLAGQSTWTWFDLDTGEQRDLLVGPAAESFGTVAVRGGVVANRLGRVDYLPLPLVDARELLEGAVAAVPSGSFDSVWLLSEPPPMERRRAVGTLVDLTGRVLAGPIDVSGQYIPAGTSDGLMFTRGGRTFLATEEGVEVLAVGDLLGAGGEFAVVYTCDEVAACGLERIDVGSGERVALPELSLLPDGGWVLTVAPDGRVALGSWTDAGFVLELRDDDGLHTWDLRVPGEPTPSGGLSLAWLPGDLGVVAAMSDGHVHRFHLEPDGTPRREVIPGLELDGTDVLLVVPR